MSVLVMDPADAGLAQEVLAHLDLQLEAARRLLAVVLEQSAAIRRREVHAVVELTGRLHAELQRRLLVDQERTRLLERAARRLGVGVGDVTLTQLEQMMDPALALAARQRSAELRGLLDQVQREHHVNRVLMHQELAFLDHLLKLTGGEHSGAYDAGAARRPARPGPLPARHRVLDLEV